jgi:hypothetical protein
MRFLKLFPTVVFAGLLLLGPGSADADIINPDFETGDFTGWSHLASWAINADGGSSGPHYAHLVSPVTDYPPTGDVIWVEEGRWISILSQTFSIPSWAQDIAIDVRNAGLNVSVRIYYGFEDGELPTKSLCLTDQSPTVAPNGFSRYAVDITDYAGLNARIDIEAGPAGIPHAEVAVDHVNITPEPCTFALIGACVGIIYIRGRFEKTRGYLHGKIAYFDGQGPSRSRA